MVVVVVAAVVAAVVAVLAELDTVTVVTVVGVLVVELAGVATETVADTNRVDIMFTMGADVVDKVEVVLVAATSCRAFKVLNLRLAQGILPTAVCAVIAAPLAWAFKVSVSSANSPARYSRLKQTQIKVGGQAEILPMEASLLVISTHSWPTTQSALVVQAGRRVSRPAVRPMASARNSCMHC
mmetsp:Transcript_80195/g.227042  ORF Transcript_80195/g.227042 Transcript_80195/m.227042 type:complete len:183 (-) Transcript_80195:124-672(-)